MPSLQRWRENIVANCFLLSTVGKFKVSILTFLFMLPFSRQASTRPLHPTVLDGVWRLIHEFRKQGQMTRYSMWIFIERAGWLNGSDPSSTQTVHTRPTKQHLVNCPFACRMNCPGCFAHGGYFRNSSSRRPRHVNNLQYASASSILTATTCFTSIFGIYRSRRTPKVRGLCQGYFWGRNSRWRI